MSQSKIQHAQSSDAQRVLQRQVAFQLHRKLQQEKRDSNINNKKLYTKWRKLLRDAKIERVTADMEIMMQSHKRDVDMRDAHLQQLDVDTEEAEEQTRYATNAHARRLNGILLMQDERLAALEEEFNKSVAALKSAHVAEYAQQKEQFDEEKFSIQHLIAVLHERQESAMEDGQAEFERQREVLSSEHLESFHQLQSQMDSRLQNLSSKFEDEHTSYITNTDERTQVYKGLLLRDRTLVSSIASRKQGVKNLKQSVAMWKIKLVNGNRDEERRNNEMEEAKSSMLSQYRTLKGRMRYLHTIAERKLKRMAVHASECKASLAEQTTTAERILKLHERARRLESETEKIAPFHDARGIRPSSRLAKLAGAMDPKGSLAGGGGLVRPQPSVASMGSSLWEGAPEGPQSPTHDGLHSIASSRAEGHQAGSADNPARFSTLESISMAEEVESKSLELPPEMIGSSRMPDDVETPGMAGSSLDSVNPDVRRIHEAALQDGLPAHLAETTALRRGADRVSIGHEYLLDGYYHKYNKVLAEKLTIEQGLADLKRENQQLRAIAAQHLEGVSLQSHTLEGPNPLFVVNGRSSIHESQPSLSVRPRSAVDATTLARSATKISLGITASLRG